MARTSGIRTIQNGPSKWDLMLALFDGSTADKNLRPVTFSLIPEPGSNTNDRTIEVVVNSISRESGDGESWILRGYVPDNAASAQFEAYYNTQRRGGHIKLVF